MAIIKLLEYTFDNTIDDNCLPAFKGVGEIEISDVVEENITTRIINVEESGLPTEISFNGKTALLSVGFAEMKNVTSMFNMFNGCKNLTAIDTSTWVTDKVSSLAYSFQNCPLLTELDFTFNNFDNVNTAVYAFYLCRDLVSVKGLSLSEQLTNITNMFGGCSSLKSLDLSNINTSNVTRMSSLFNGCSSLSSVDLSNWNTCNAVEMSGMFMRCSSLTSLDLSNFDTSSATTMTNMFGECSNLERLDVSSFNTENVTSMYQTFSGCSSLTSLNVSNFNTSKVTDMRNMFRACRGIKKLKLGHFDTSNVTNMVGVFNNCSSLIDLDLTGWNTTNVVEMNSMFENCSSLTSLDLSHFDTSRVSNIVSIFLGCSSLESLNISSFTFNSATSTQNMFSNCRSLKTLDLSNAIMTNVTNTSNMFYNCSKLNSIGLLYSDAETINRVVSLLPTATVKDVYYLDAALNELAEVSGINFIKYKSLSVSLDQVNLKRIDDIYDTLDLVTGKLTQRVGEYTFDGTNTPSLYHLEPNRAKGYTVFPMMIEHVFPTAKSNPANKLKQISNNFNWIENAYGSRSGGKWISVNYTYLIFSIPNDELESLDVNGFNKWMSKNPTTVYCPINDRIIDVALNVQDQNGQRASVLSSMENGRIQVTSQELTPSIEYEIPTANSYHVDIIKSNTEYTMKNMQGTFTIGGLQYNASSNGTFITPSDMSDSFIVTSEEQTNPMILEGDFTDQSLPYFNGIRSLFDEADEIEILSTKKNLLNPKTFELTPLNINSAQSFTYDETSDTYEFLCPDSYNQMQIRFKNKYGITSDRQIYVSGTYECNGDVKNVDRRIEFRDGGKVVSITIIDSSWKAVTKANLKIMFTHDEIATTSPYEPHVSNTTRIALPMPLRSLPNGVSDELIIDRSKNKATLIQRVGVDNLDGRQGWTNINSSVDVNLYQPFYGYGFGNMAIAKSKEITVRCEKIKAVSNVTTYGKLTENAIYQYTDNSARLAGQITKKDLNGRSVTQWFRDNPVTLYYQLELPIITEVDLNGYPYLYRDGYIFISPNTEGLTFKPTVGLEYTVNQGQRILNQADSISRHEKSLSNLEKYYADLVYSDYNLAVLRFNEEIR